MRFVMFVGPPRTTPCFSRRVSEEETTPMAPSSPELSSPEIIDPDAVRRVYEHQIAAELIAQVAEIFKALADPTRVRIMHALSHAELCVGDLAAVLEMSESAVSHQLRLLRGLRVVRARRDGKLVFYALDDEHVTRLFQLSLEHLGHS
jgi:DNA-binding transcriptional ArsR family regulator